MIKYALLLFNMFSLVIYQVLFTDDVKITQAMPSEAKPGTEFTVELTINKGSIGGFAKIQQELPEGFTATVVDSKGASFTFSNQSVKFIWTALPADAEFKISYKVITTAQVNGAKTLRGKFSYVYNNERQTSDIAPATITIGDAVLAQDSKNTTAPVTEKKDSTLVTTTNTKADSSVSTAASTETKTEPVTTAPATSSGNAPSTGSGLSAVTQSLKVSCSRKITKNENTNEYTVEIKVIKENITGFAKILETVPTNYTATGIETSNSSFTFTEQKAKFVWVNLPAQAEFTISYKLVPGPKASPDGIIDGVFSYIENDETKKFVIPPSSLQTAGQPSLASSNPPATKSTSPTSTASATTTNTTTTKDITKAPAETNENTTAKQQTQTSNEPPLTEASKNTETKTQSASTQTNPITSSIPAPQTGVFYRVQIAATQKYTDMSYFTKKHTLLEKIYADMHEGWNKYSVGQHGEYRQARDHREEVKNKGIKGPFVTAFNSGNRITVQEALMITNQKWFK